MELGVAMAVGAMSFVFDNAKGGDFLWEIKCAVGVGSGVVRRLGACFSGSRH